MSAPPSEELVRHRLRLCAGRGCLACGVELRLSELVDAVLAIADPWIADRIRLSLLRALLRLADDEGGPRMTVLGIDPGLRRTGIALVARGRIIAAHTVHDPRQLNRDYEASPAPQFPPWPLTRRSGWRRASGAGSTARRRHCRPRSSPRPSSISRTPALLPALDGSARLRRHGGAQPARPSDHLAAIAAMAGWLGGEAAGVIAPETTPPAP